MIPRPQGSQDHPFKVLDLSAIPGPMAALAPVDPHCYRVNFQYYCQ